MWRTTINPSNCKDRYSLWAPQTFFNISPRNIFTASAIRVIYKWDRRFRKSVAYRRRSLYSTHPIGIVLKKAVGHTYGSPTAILCEAKRQADNSGHFLRNASFDCDIPNYDIHSYISPLPSGAEILFGQIWKSYLLIAPMRSRMSLTPWRAQ